MPTIEVRRDHVYSAIWTGPIEEVANKFGLFFSGMHRVCLRLNLQIPPSSQWYGLRGEKRITPAPYSQIPEGACTVVEVHTPSGAPIVETLSKPDVVVPRQLRDPHPLIEITRAELERGTPDEYGRIQTRGRRGLDIRVSPSELSRSLRLADALVKAIERLGYGVETGVGMDRKYVTWAVIENEKVRFMLREPSNEKRLKPHSNADSRYLPRRTHVPSGRLELLIDEYTKTGAPKAVRDGRSGNNIETKLGSFIVGLHTCALVDKVDRLAREADNLRRREEQIRTEERKRILAYRLWLRTHLVNVATAHREACEIRALISSLKTSHTVDGYDDRLSAWLKWAQAEAEQLDPVSSPLNIPQPLDPPTDWKATTDD